jgi:hypothetical protein
MIRVFILQEKGKKDSELYKFNEMEKGTEYRLFLDGQEIAKGVSCCIPEFEGTKESIEISANFSFEAFYIMPDDTNAIQGIFDAQLRRLNAAWVASTWLPRKKKKHVRKYIKAWSRFLIARRP